MSWFVANRDLISITLAFAAIILSLYTALLSRSQQRLSAFVQIQEMMRHPDLQHGRRLVYRIGRGAEPPEVDTDDHYAISAALSTFDLLACYSRRRLVPRSWVLDHWHARLRDLRPGFKVMVDRRVGRTRELEPWPDLSELVEWAYRYKCLRPCCNASSETPTPPTRVMATESGIIEPRSTESASWAGRGATSTPDNRAASCYRGALPESTA